MHSILSRIWTVPHLPCLALSLGIASLGTDLGLSDAEASPVQYVDRSAAQLPLGAVSNNSMDARPADIDGDGDLDLVIAVEFRPNVILINDGSGTFSNESAARIAQPFHDSEDVGIADFDGDGSLDIIFVAEDDQTNEFYLNDGSGFFTDESARIPVLGTSNAVLVAMVNDDSFPDIIIGNAGQNVVLINDGAANFTDETAARLPANTNITQDLEWGDVDGDGNPDLVEGNEDGNRLLLNDGTGVFTDVTAAQLPLPGAGEETREADLGDVDRDGDLDLFFANVTFGQGNPPQNRLLINDGNGVFVDETAARLPVSGDFTVDGDFVDLNHDGHLDLVTAQAFVGTYEILINDGSGVFSDQTAALFDTPPTGNGIDVEAADFNGDELVDLYLTGFQRADYLYVAELPTSTTPSPNDPPRDSGSLIAPRAHPNPFRGSASIDFRLAEPQEIELQVINVAGEVIERWPRRVLPAGQHRETWTPRSAPSGRYYVRWIGDHGVRSQGLLYLK